MRKSEIERNTAETKIRLALELDGTGESKVETGVGFFDHMLTLFAKHARFDMDIRCDGDVRVDAHHTVEDCGIVLGQAVAQALGKKEGVARYATQFVPMDETLVMASVDISGRPYFVYHVELANARVGNFDAELCEEFFRAFCMGAGLALHINLMYGKNTHHIMEAAFKAVARAMGEAARIDPNIKGVLSTKGVL